MKQQIIVKIKFYKNFTIFKQFQHFNSQNMSKRFY